MKIIKRLVLPILVIGLLIGFICLNRYEVIGYNKQVITMSVFDSIKLDILIALEAKKELTEGNDVTKMNSSRSFRKKLTKKQYNYFNAYGFLGKNDRWQMIDPFGKLANFIMELYIKYQLEEIYQMSVVLEVEESLPKKIVADANWYAICSNNKLKEAFDCVSMQYSDDEELTMYDFWIVEKGKIELNTVIQYGGLRFKLVEIKGDEFVVLFGQLKR